MRADNTDHLITAAKRRHELTRAKAIKALRELDQDGAPVTFETVAQHADISRAWLYTQPDLRAEVERLRAATRRAPTPSVPAAQRASDASLLARLQTANERNRRLAKENDRLRRQLAHALGDQRARDRAVPPRPETDDSPSSVTIGPC